MYPECGGEATRTYRGGHPLHLHTEHEPHSTNPYWPGSPSFAAMMFHLGHVVTQKKHTTKFKIFEISVFPL